jgi:nuclease S1
MTVPTCLRNALFIIWLLPSSAFAWGAEGHRIIALIAADELTPSPRAQVQALLASPDARSAMEDASTWADEIKFQRPGTRPWHYVDIEIGTRGYDKAANCPDRRLRGCPDRAR